MASDFGKSFLSAELASASERPTAVVVAVQLTGVTDEELDSSCAELERLANTAGLRCVGRVTQRRSKLASGIVLGQGKLHELALWTGGTGEIPAYEKPGTRKMKPEDMSDMVDEDQEDDDPEDEEPDETIERDANGDAAPRAQVVLVDHDLTPTQQRNLERATGAEVLDRSSVILEIFHRHARTREARLQVEIARLRYLAPRLRESTDGGDRVRGGIGGKGAGETSMELDKRRIRDRIAELRHELAQIDGGAANRRDRRSELPTVALVGYTNAGKSSLMRNLTSTDVYVADKLFATLDTTVRRLQPPTEPPILVTDTVGFIKKLPHDLVASFRSTLDEAAGADLLLHLVDAADPAMADQLAVTREVLGEIGAEHVNSLLVLNKIDRVDEAGRQRLSDRYPGAHQMSAKSAEDVAALRELIIGQLIGKMEDGEFDVPWAAQRFVHQIHERTTVVSEVHHDDGTRLVVRAPNRVLDALRTELAAADAQNANA
ncbi:MAG: GTPase HflX [Proteobacteria bacterium]|nr:GTPase HflX [Pseudomonadota bacterium]